jgi:hypothetical protein
MAEHTEPRNWDGISLLDLEPGLELGGFDSLDSIDTFNDLLSSEMLGLIRYGDIGRAADFVGHPALFSHPSRRSTSDYGISSELMQPVISHAYTLEDVTVRCLGVRLVPANRTHMFDRTEQTDEPGVKAVRQIAMVNLRSRLTDEIISAAGIKYNLGLYRPHNWRQVGKVAVKRAVDPVIFHETFSDLYARKQLTQRPGHS